MSSINTILGFVALFFLGFAWLYEAKVINALLIGLGVEYGMLLLIFKPHIFSSSYSNSSTTSVGDLAIFLAT